MAQRRRSSDRDEIRPLIELTERFLRGDLDAATYDDRLRRAFSRLGQIEEERFFALENLAVACSEYIREPELRVESTDLDDDGLRLAAVRALARLALA